MSGGRYTSSGANTVPLGSRQCIQPVRNAEESSLLKPDYLKNASSSASSDILAWPPKNMEESIMMSNDSFENQCNSVPTVKASSSASEALAKAASIASQLGKRKSASNNDALSAYSSPGSIDTRPGMEQLAQLSQQHDAALHKPQQQPQRKRKSRWSNNDNEKTCIPGMPTSLPAGLSKEQEEAYLLQIKIEDATRRLRSGDLGIPPNPDDRSPSPEPVYSTDGKRMNTREYRKRKQLEEMRHAAVLRMGVINSDYMPPADYKPPLVKICERVFIPHEEYPAINFVGLLIGPRGNTLKALEKETGAKIIIRGKGSIKEGKVGRKDGMPLPGEDEPLHAYVTSTCPEAVIRGVAKVQQVISEGVSVPESQNDLRKHQLRELALLNGTLRDGDIIRCTNCGATDHKSWQCQDKPTVTNNIQCTTCCGIGHIAKDCMLNRPGATLQAGNPTGVVNSNKMDHEYMSFMAELGEGPPPPKNNIGGWQPPPAPPMGQCVRPPMAIMGPPGDQDNDQMNFPNFPSQPTNMAPPGWVPPPRSMMMQGPGWNSNGSSNYGLPPPPPPSQYMDAQPPEIMPPPPMEHNWEHPPWNENTSCPVPRPASAFGKNLLESPNQPVSEPIDSSSINNLPRFPHWGGHDIPDWPSGQNRSSNAGVLSKLMAAPPPPPPPS